ncbi:hypothetical protein Tco_1273739 [Tanacetum coccineum]
MLLLIAQQKIDNLEGDVIVDFVTALKMFTRSIVVHNRVEDVQLGVESYQRKLNLLKPQRTCPDITGKELYTPNYDPKELEGSTQYFPLDSVEVLRHHGPSDAKHNPSQPLKVGPQVHVKMAMEIPRSSKVKFIAACSYSINEYNYMKKAQIAATIDFPQQIQDRILESQLVDDLKMKLNGMQEENDKLKRVSIRSSQLLEYEKLLEYDGFKSSFFYFRYGMDVDHEMPMVAKCYFRNLLQTYGDILLLSLLISIDHPLLDSPERPGPMDWQNLMSGQPATSTWNSLDEQSFLQGVGSSERLGPLDWDNLMSRQLTTGTSNSLDEQRGVLRLQSTGHVLAATAFSTYICL